MWRGQRAWYRYALIFTTLSYSKYQDSCFKLKRWNSSPRTYAPCDHTQGMLVLRPMPFPLLSLPAAHSNFSLVPNPSSGTRSRLLTYLRVCSACVSQPNGLNSSTLSAVLYKNNFSSPWTSPLFSPSVLPFLKTLSSLISSSDHRNFSPVCCFLFS